MPRRASVYIAETLAEAQQLRRRLADYGIEATVHDDGLSRDAGRVRVLVELEDFEFSQEVVEEFEAKRRPRYGRSSDHPNRRGSAGTYEDNDDNGAYDAHHARDGGADDDSNAAQAEAEIDGDWPRCPECYRPRLAICPACQTAGSRFRLAGDHSGSSAWLDSASSLARPLLVCSTCDHPFTPEFYRRCEGCGHNFPDGLDTPRATPVEEAARQGGTFLATLGLIAAALYVAWRLLR